MLGNGVKIWTAIDPKYVYEKTDRFVLVNDRGRDEDWFVVRNSFVLLFSHFSFQGLYLGSPYVESSTSVVGSQRAISDTAFLEYLAEVLLRWVPNFPV